MLNKIDDSKVKVISNGIAPEDSFIGYLIKNIKKNYQKAKVGYC